jgi:hypothetical protein
MTSGRFSRRALVVIVAASVVLRVALCARGGQYFFGDELRYDRAVQLYFAVANWDTHAVREILALPDHALFTWMGALVTAAQRILALATPYGDWSHHREFAGFTIRLGSCVLSLFSALNVLLVYRLARVLRADREEAVWAALVMAASNTAFYYSRHLLPYDCAISAALLAMLAGLGAPTVPRAALCGILAGCAYHLYNGYWFLPPLVFLAYSFVWWGQPRRAALAAALGAGFALAFGVPLLVGTIAGGAEYWQTLAAFSGTVTQGLFSEGWSLPWAYLWASEGWAGAALAACVVLALVREVGARRPLEFRAAFWLALLAAAYGFLVLSSTVMEKFVVYGRTVKPLVPLVCLLAGWGLRHLIGERTWLRVLVSFALAASCFLSFAPHFFRVFPRDAEIAVMRDLGNPKRSLSVSGSIYIPLPLPVTRPDLVLVNAQMIYPIRGYIGYPEGTTLMRIEHPLTYAPFQFEGHTPRERAILQSEDISIRLIRLADPARTPDDLPLNLRFQNSDRPTGR